MDELRHLAVKALAIRWITITALTAWLGFLGMCSFNDYTNHRQVENILKSYVGTATTPIEAACALQILEGIRSGGVQMDSMIIRDVCQAATGKH